MTDPTEEEIEAAAVAWAEGGPSAASWELMAPHVRVTVRKRMRAALLAAQAVRKEQGR